MRYIAGFFDKTALLVDSETGEELYVTRSQLEALVRNETIGGTLVDIGILMEAIPYQPTSCMTSLQVKTSVFKNVDIITYKDTVTGIYVRHNDANNPVSIRLSTFGTKCADFILTGNRRVFNTNLLTLVLDDKLSYRKNTFNLYSFVTDEFISYGIGDIGMSLDVREMTDMKSVIYAYRAAIRTKSDIVNGLKRVIDSPERKSLILESLRGSWRDWFGS